MKTAFPIGLTIRSACPIISFSASPNHADLSAELGDARRGDVTVNGLITILNSYKFTVTEIRRLKKTWPSTRNC
jgi:hypothetical protein